MLSFAGKTAIITGAGGALGRVYALNLAKRGCQIVVNDLGSTLSGEPHLGDASHSSADAVVREIISKGGKAVANYNSVVTDSQDIAEFALKTYGSCDILINNAGNLRNSSFSKLSKEDWKAVLDVHLHGTTMMCHAVWPEMQRQGYGRIINVGAGAGLYGNFGQANYSAAKLGVLGLTSTLAKEGARSNIMVNYIVPVAGSRLNDALQKQQTMNAEQIGPIVTFLSHESCTYSGGCYEIAGGLFSQVRFERSAGVKLNDGATPCTPEDIAENMDKISDFSNPEYPTGAEDAIKAILALESLQSTEPTLVPGNPAMSSSSSSSSSSKSSSNGSLSSMISSMMGSSSSSSGSIISSSSSSNSKNSNSNSNSSSGAKCESEKLFVFLQAMETANPKRWKDLVGEIGAKVLFDITTANGDKAHWFVDFADESKASVRCLAPEVMGSIVGDAATKPKVTIACSAETIKRLSSGALSTEYAYLQGSIKVRGNMQTALRVKALLKVGQDLF